MKSATSCCECGGWFSRALLRKNITRFSPIWGIYTLILFVLIPVPIYTSAVTSHGVYYSYLKDMASMTSVVGFLYGIIMAMGLFSYLMNNRSAQLIHSLPIRREGLFFTNWVSGLLFTVVPNVLIFAVSVLGLLAFGSDSSMVMLQWLLLQTCADLFFFSLAIFCGMFTGNLLAMPIFYGILNFLAYAICFLVGVAVQELTVGITFRYDSQTLRFLTPTLFLMDNVMGSSEKYLVWENVGINLVYTLVGAVLFSMLALSIYRLRQLERAGDLITVGWMRPVFQICMGIGCGMLIGYFTYGAFFYGFRGKAVLIGLCVFWTVLFAIGARMLLNKTLRVLKKGWKSFLITGLAMVLLMVGIRMDLPGRQRYVPDADRISDISIYYNGNVYYNFFLDQPEQIEAWTEVHRAIVRQLELAEQDVYAVPVSASLSDNGYEQENMGYVDMIYRMKNGTTLERSYHFLFRAQDMTDPSSAASMLESFFNRPDIALYCHFDGSLFQDGRLNDLTAVNGTLNGETESQLELDSAQANRLLDAFLEDLAAGRVKMSLLWDRDAQANDLATASLYVVDLSQTGAANGSGNDYDMAGAYNIRVPIQRSCTSMVKVLVELGADPATGQMPHTQTVN